MIFSLFAFFLPLLAFSESFEVKPNKQVENLQSLLASMPIEDKYELESLFRLLIADGDFAYTLFGDKPVSCSDFFVDFEKLGFFLNQSSFDLLSAAHKGLVVWEKYKPFFESSPFNLVSYSTQDYDWIGFVLYHKEKVKTLYEKHQPLMKDVFRNAKNLAQLICTPTNESIKFINDENSYHEALGLLLGYDEASVQKFREGYDLMDALAMGPFALDGLNSKKTEGVLQRLDKKLAHSDHFGCKKFSRTDIIERLNRLSNSKPVRLSQRDEALSPIRIPGYGANEGEPEVILRQEGYDKVRGRITEILFSENFLEIILTRLQS
ncbi:MAG: hypothetical protein H0T62_07025 [Parachlamydiaceae bacterium]|nr:hypothetical protein [Parachlamydiaceae bacterium]